MARYEDAAAGWTIFREHHGHITLEELNQMLRAQGRRPVAKRTFNHYRKLYRLGYEEYVSINRLDLRHASDSVFDIADRSRYEELEVTIPAVLYLPTATDLKSFEGTVVRVSDGFASFRTVNTPEAAAACRSTKYNKGVLLFTRVGVERAVRIQECVESDGTLELLLTFRSLLAPDILFPDRVGPVSASRLTVGLPDGPTLSSVVVALHRSFDLYESLRGMLETVTSGLQPDDRPVLAAPRVKKLQTGSPFILEVLGSPWVWVLVGALLPKVVPTIREGVGVVRDVQEIRHAGNRERREQEKHSLEIEALQLDNLKKSIDVMELLREAEEATGDTRLADLREMIERKAERLGLLKDQAVEAAAELALESGGQVEFEEIEDDDLD